MWLVLKSPEARLSLVVAIGEFMVDRPKSPMDARKKVFTIYGLVLSLGASTPITMLIKVMAEEVSRYVKNGVEKMVLPILLAIWASDHP